MPLSRLTPVFLMLCFLFAAASAAAAMVGADPQAHEIQPYYEMEVQVDDTTPGTRQKAIRVGLEQVLLKNPELAPAEARQLTQVMSEAGNYVQRYRYLRPGEAGAAGQPRGKLALWLRFDGYALARELAPPPEPAPTMTDPGAGPFPEHIELLLWLAVRDGKQSYLMSEDRRDSEIGRALQTAASRHGVNLLLPLMDLDDQRQITFKDIWGGYTDRVAEASARYGVPDRLTGRIYRDSESEPWSGDWVLQRHGSDDQWQNQPGTLSGLFEETLSRISGRHAPEPAGESSGLPDDGAEIPPYETPEQPLAITGEMTLSVEGVRSISDYARISEYLRQLAPVKHARVLQVDDSRVEFSLELVQERAVLEAVIARGGILLPADDGVTGHYRIRP